MTRSNLNIVLNASNLRSKFLKNEMNVVIDVDIIKDSQVYAQKKCIMLNVE